MLDKMSNSGKSKSCELKTSDTEVQYSQKIFELNDGPKHCSYFCNDSSPLYVSVAVHNKISVFREDSFELVWSIQTDDSIGCIVLSEDSCLLFVAEVSGLFHIYHIPTKTSLWNRMCQSEEFSPISLFQVITSIDSSGLLTVHIITLERIMFVISGISIRNLYSAIENGTVAEIFYAVHLEEINLAKLYPSYHISHVFPMFWKTVPVGFGFHSVESKNPMSPKTSDSSEVIGSTQELETSFCNITILSETFTEDSLIDEDSQIDKEDLPCSNTSDDTYRCYDFSVYGRILKAVHTRDGQYLVLLDSKNCIRVVCAHTDITVKIWNADNNVADFVMNETVDPSSRIISEQKIGLKCLQTSDEGLKYTFEIRKFPSFELIQTMDTTDFVLLVECKPNQDFWYFICGDTLPSSDPSGELQIANLKMTSLSECQPKAKLVSLVHKGKFQEAENLAMKSNLSAEIIHKSKINCLLYEFSQKNCKNMPKEEIEVTWKAFEDSLKYIKDLAFIKSCISFVLPEMNHMKRLLLCIRNWLMEMDNSKDIAEMISLANQNLNKLVTYEIFTTSLDSCMTLETLLHKDLLEYMISELHQEHLSSAFIIWQRHKDELLVALNVETVERIITAIPSSSSTKILIPFLQEDLLPPIFLRCPDSIDKVAAWISRRVCDLEIYERDLWPGNGLQLLEVSLKEIRNLHSKEKESQISFSTGLASASAHKNMISTEYHIGVLAEFLRDLVWIEALKTDFNCKVCLCDFKESRIDVIFAVLDRIDLGFLPKALDKFARPFALEHGLDLEVCLEEYIKRTVQESGLTWFSLEEDPTEERLVSVIDNIVTSDRWVNASLLVMSRAAVPWSDRLQRIVKKALEWDHPRRTEFLLQSKSVGLKEMLVKYNMRSFRINNDEKLISVFVNYILKQNRPSAFEDARKVLTSVCENVLEFDVYYRYLLFALNQNKVDDMLQAFSGLSQDTAVKCSTRLLQYIKLCLDDTFLMKSNEELTKNLLYAGVYLLNYLKKTEQTVDEKLLVLFRSMEKLQDEFSLCVTLSELSSESYCQALIESAIHKFVTKNIVPEKDGNSSMKKHTSFPPSILMIYRLGHILLIEREKILGLLITECLKEQKYSLVLTLCNEIISSYQTSDAAQMLMQVVEHFYLNFDSIKSINFAAMVDTIYHLTGVAVTHLSEDSLSENWNVVQLSTFLYSIKEITGKHSLLVSPEFMTDSYNQWKFSPVYKDEGFQLDCDAVTNFVKTLYKLPKQLDLSTSKENTVEVDNFLSHTLKLVDHMMETGHGITILRTLYLYCISQSRKSQTSDISQIFSAISSIVERCVFSILQRALSQRKVDLNFTYNVLIILPEEHQYTVLQQLLKWSSRDLNRLTVVGKIGMELAHAHERTVAFDMYSNIFKKASLLSKQNIKSVPMEIILNASSPESNWAVVKDLIISQKLDLAMVYECCNAFQLNTDHVLTVYLNNILMQAEKKSLSSGNIEAEVGPTLRKADFVIRCIENEELAYSNLLSLIKKVSPYSYEILLFIKEQLCSLSANIQTISSNSFEKDIKLLKFLKVYKRITPADDLEGERWRSLQPTDPKLPAISNTRLPFHYFLQENLHKIINPELTANTLKVWLKIATLLKTPPDHMIIIAVKNNVTNYLEHLSSQRIVLNPDVSFVGIINDMIERISADESAVGCASWLPQKMPPGGNRVSFASMAVKFARIWYEKLPPTENVVNIYKKLTSLYRQYAIENALYKNNLVDDIALTLTHSPIQLIEYLLEDFLLLSNKSSKVCKAILEVATIADVKLVHIFLKYIFKWLNVTQTTASNLDETFLQSSLEVNNFEEDTDNENLIRIINLLLNVPESLFPSLYIEIKQSFTQMQIIQRSRLLFCLVSIFDSTTISNLLDWDRATFEFYLIPMLCAIELESLDLPYSVPLFVKCDKAELIQKILSTKFKYPKAIVFCIRLCLEYNIWEAPLWEAILKRLTLNPKDYAVQDILEAVQGHLVHMWHSESFVAAWKCAINSILKMEPVNDLVFLPKLYKSLLKCPCASALDVKSLAGEIKYIVKADEQSMKEMERVTDVCALISILMTLVERRSIISCGTP